MTPTDEIRARLDELGIEHFDHENGEPLRDLSEAGADPATSWRMGDASVCAVPNKQGTFDLWIDNCTPEQAIAATVGRRDTMELWPEWEQVLFANVSDEVAQDNLNECVHELLEKAATVGAGTCYYIPDETGFTWWDENDVEHYEEYSASDECSSASCDKCGYTMMVGDDGWFDGWDEIIEWTEEDGSEHKGYVLKPRFKHCPNCGARVVSE